MTLLILSQIACNRGPGADAINLEWKSGEVFHVAASYQNAGVMTEETPASLDGSVETGFGEDWSDEVVWTYEVVETGVVPEANDALYAYSVKFDGEQTSLAVIRAYLDETLNTDDALLESDPVIYLVFREDRDRLAGLVSFTDVDGERVEKAYSSTELGKSWNNLSQSELTMLPTMLAPFGTSVELLPAGVGEAPAERSAVRYANPHDIALARMLTDAMGGEQAGWERGQLLDGDPADLLELVVAGDATHHACLVEHCAEAADLAACEASSCQ